MAQPQNQKVELIKTKSLGIGSCGAVYKAIYGDLPCAAKILHPTLFQFTAPETTSVMQQFEQECRLLSAIKHPHIVQYLDTCRDPESGLPVLLMELMDESLTQFLKHNQEPLPYHTVVNLCHDIALALSYLHSNGILHRDLSSNNVLLIAGSRAKVTDFGMAKFYDVNRTSLTQCPGTLVYMPPEALSDSPVYTCKLDSFSFGVLCVQILTRQFPNPSNRVTRVESSQSPTGVVEVPVPEIERRKSHIHLIDPAHSLMQVVHCCLKDRDIERPSTQELCHYISELKVLPEYVASVQQSQVRGARILRESSACQKEIQQLQEQLQSSEQVTAEFQQKLTEREETVQVLQQHAQSLQQLLQSKDHQLQGQQQEIQQHRQHVLQLQQHLTSKDKQLVSKDKQLASKDEQLADKNHQLQLKKEAIATRQQQFRQQLQSSEQVTAVFQQNLTEREKTIQELKRQIENLQQLLQSKDDQLQRLQPQIQQHRQEILQLQQQLTSKDKQLVSKDDQLASKEKQIASKDEQLSDKTHQLQLKETAIATHQQQFRQQLQSSEQVTAAFQQNLKEREKTVQQLQRQIENLQLLLQSKDHQLQGRQQENQQHRQQVLQLQQQLTSKDNQLVLKDKQLASKEEQVADKKRQLQLKEAAIATHQQEIQQLRQQLQSSEQVTAELLQNLLMANSDQPQTFQHQLTGKDEQLASKDEQLASKEEQLASKEEQLGGKDKQLVDEEQWLQQEEAAIATYQQESQQLQQQLKSCKQVTTDFQQYLILEREETVQDQQKQIEELQRQPSQRSGQRREEKAAASGAAASGGSIKLRWRDGGRAPHKMNGKATATNGRVAYFLPGQYRSAGILTYNYSKSEWSELPECPNHDFSLAVVNGCLTAIGGQTPNNEVTNSLLSFFVTDRKWRVWFPPMPTKRCLTAVVCGTTSLAVAGGEGERFKKLSTVEVMNLATLKWSTASSLPHPLYQAHSATLCGDQLYLLGGFDQQKRKLKSVFTCSLSSLLQSCHGQLGARLRGLFAIKSDVWHKIADTQFYFSTSVQLHGQLLAIGGEDSDKRPTNAVHLYNTTTNSWEVVSHMATPRCQCSVAVLPNNELVVVGGHTADGQLSDSVEIATIV